MVQGSDCSERAKRFWKWAAGSCGNLPDSGALFRIVLPLRVERTPAAAEANHLREDS